MCFQKSHFRVLLCTRQRVKRFQKVPKVNDHFLIDLNSWYFNRQQFRLYILMCQIFGCLALIKTGFIRVNKWHEFGVTKWPIGVTGVFGVTSVKIFKKVNFYKFLGPISFFYRLESCSDNLQQKTSDRFLWKLNLNFLNKTHLDEKWILDSR